MSSLNVVERIACARAPRIDTPTRTGAGGRLRDLKAAPEDMEIEAIEPVERTARALQATELALANFKGEDRIANPSKDQL